MDRRMRLWLILVFVICFGILPYTILSIVSNGGLQPWERTSVIIVSFVGVTVGAALYLIMVRRYRGGRHRPRHKAK